MLNGTLYDENHNHQVPVSKAHLPFTDIKWSAWLRRRSQHTSVLRTERARSVFLGLVSIVVRKNFNVSMNDLLRVLLRTYCSQVINFCANNYLGLANNQQVIDAAKHALVSLFWIAVRCNYMLLFDQSTVVNWKLTALSRLCSPGSGLEIAWVRWFSKHAYRFCGSHYAMCPF